MDLRDLFSETDPLSPAWVLNLIMWLPTTSAFYASRRGGYEFRGWDAGRYAMVAAVNELKSANHLTLLVNRDPKKGSKPQAPKSFPIPDDLIPKPPKPGSFAAMVVAAKKAARENKEKRNG